ncbi:MAG TPA: nucleoside phosphorylase [Thermoanaerobacterales bacterium]|nr:nucleoside phosphorylase [Thermoanaerobacterales bacterium]
MVYESSIDLDSTIGARYAILPGDPARVKKIVEFLDNPKPLSVHREYTSYEGFIDGEKVIVMSTGMGGPSMAIGVEELFKIGAKYYAGVVQSKDSLYGQHDPLRMPIGKELKARYDTWIKAGALASEMECAALFIVAQTLGARAGAVLHCLWNKEREEAGLDSPTMRDMTKAILTVREGIRELIKQDKAK